jgi:hypothetical protein
MHGQKWYTSYYLSYGGMNMNNSNIIITISRQVGSGGNYLGQRLAKKLNLLYMDDEIVREAAKDMGHLLKISNPMMRRKAAYGRIYCHIVHVEALNIVRK